jgi:hypothetical protein
MGVKRNMTTHRRRTRAWKLKLHRGLVLGQLAAALVSVWFMAHIGFGAWTFASLGFAVVLMLTSMGLQAWWIIQDSREPRLVRNHESSNAPAPPTLSHTRNKNVAEMWLDFGEVSGENVGVNKSSIKTSEGSN